MKFGKTYIFFVFFDFFMKKICYYSGLDIETFSRPVKKMVLHLEYMI